MANGTAFGHEAPIQAHRVREILARIAGVRLGVCGDFCLDAYWMLDPRGGEVSSETGLRAQAVARHRYAPGGAGNIVANAAALRPAGVRAIGVVGEDLFGRELLRQLEGLGADTAAMVAQGGTFDTVTYGKRYAGDLEQPRLDFGFFNERSPETDAAVLAHLERALRECDAVVFNQQVPGSLAERFIDGVNAAFREHPQAIVLCDSRHYRDRFTTVCRKANDVEAAALGGVPLEPGGRPSLPDLEACAARLFAESGKPVFITRGPRGIVTADGSGIHVAPGVRLAAPVDSVGAGDTIISALALALAAGVRPPEAAAFANLAAAVTVQKLFQTGTASPDEVLALCERIDQTPEADTHD